MLFRAIYRLKHIFYLFAENISRYYLCVSDCEILFDQRVSKFLVNDNKWKIYCENNSEYEFDAIIFTIPVPQMLQLDGILSYVQGLTHFIFYY